MFKFLSFTTNQKSIIEKCKLYHIEASGKWVYLNVFFPILAIICALPFYEFAPLSKQDLRGFLLNGSFSLIGMNILFAMSSYLIKEIPMRDQTVNKEVLALKEKLNIFGYTLFFLGWGLYVYQIISPFDNVWQILTVSIFILTILIISIRIGRIMFLIKDDLLMEAFDYGENVVEEKQALMKKTENNDNEYKF